MKQRIVTALLALGLCAPLTLPARAAATFNDIPASHWSYSYVQTASNNGWVNGVGNGKYNPQWQCDRCGMVYHGSAYGLW